MAAEIAVVFCSYKRYDMLLNAVLSLIGSVGYSPDLCEIVVVDNTPLALREKRSFPNEARVIFCDEVGLSSARNAGITATDTPLVAFVDDDALVRDGWLPAVMDAFRRGKKALICGGKTRPYIQGPRPPWFSDQIAGYLSCVDWGEELRFLRPGEWVAGANVAYRRCVFEDIGLFNPALGRHGHHTLLSNEETALMKAVGLEATVYVPDMIVDHIIAQDRLTQSWFRKRVAWQATSDLLSGECYLTIEQAWSVFRKFVLAVPAEYRTLRALHYPVEDPALFERQLRALYAFGIMFGEGLSEQAA